MRRLLAALAAITLTGAVLAPNASADPSEFGIASVSATLSSVKAGAHPDFKTSFEIKTDPASEPNSFGLKRPYAITRDVTISLPAGLIGNPNAATQCTIAQLETFNFEGGGCPNSSQIGVTKIYAYALSNTFTEPIYLMAPPADGSAVARLGLIAGIIPTFINAQVRSESDYGVDANLEAVSGLQELVKAETTIWGVPAAKAHDTQRQTPLEAFNGAESSVPRPPGGEPAPFMTNPTRCGVAQEIVFAADSYSFPGVFSEAKAALPALTGCDQVDFSPNLTVRPTTRQAGEPTGLDADLTLPQNETVAGPASGQIRDATVILPNGMTIASGAADGLEACSAAEVGFGTRAASHCPDAAKIGSAEIDTPLLSRPLHGTIYQRSPEPGHLFQIWLVSDELGLHLKLAGEVHADLQNGQITSVFLDTPQAPVREFKLHFREGARAPLANPSTCGDYRTQWSFTPWSSQTTVQNQTPMRIDENCGARGFSPKLLAGTTNPLAHVFASFVTTLTRGTGEQNVAGLSITLPPGVLAKLAGVALCEGQAAQSGDCPVASLVGTTTVAAGPGSSPLWIPQPGKAPTAVYLSGPYRDAPYGLVVKVPAQAGPFDLGTVITRAGIYVDPETAQAMVKSDPLPQILEGVPVSYQTINVDVDRHEFTLNPTNCKEMGVGAKATSDNGVIARPASRFQVGGCRELPFEPKLSMRLHGKTNRGAHPRFQAVLKARSRDANIASAQVTLPHSEFLDQSHINTVCTRVEFAANQCPAGSIYGQAKAFTPLLSQPLQGSVYLRSSNHLLPDLVVALRGQVDFNLVGRIDSVRGNGIRTSFETVPDAPVTKFVLTMQGGKKGLLVNSRNACQATLRSIVYLHGQNGKRADQHPVLQADCAKSPQKH